MTSPLVCYLSSEVAAFGHHLAAQAAHALPFARRSHNRPLRLGHLYAGYCHQRLPRTDVITQMGMACNDLATDP